jgi:hypothetical protein
MQSVFATLGKPLASDVLTHTVSHTTGWAARQTTPVAAAGKFFCAVVKKGLTTEAARAPASR